METIYLLVDVVRTELNIRNSAGVRELLGGMEEKSMLELWVKIP